MTVLALAVGGRGLVDPSEPVLHADDEAFLRGRAAFDELRPAPKNDTGSKKTPRPLPENTPRVLKRR